MLFVPNKRVWFIVHKERLETLYTAYSVKCSTLNCFYNYCTVCTIIWINAAGTALSHTLSVLFWQLLYNLYFVNEVFTLLQSSSKYGFVVQLFNTYFKERIFAGPFWKNAHSWFLNIFVCCIFAGNVGLCSWVLTERDNGMGK